MSSRCEQNRLTDGRTDGIDNNMSDFFPKICEFTAKFDLEIITVLYDNIALCLVIAGND